MHHSVWLIGALTGVWGVAAVLKPEWLKRIMDFFAIGRRFWFAAAIKVVIGIALLVFARECRIPWIVIVIGILTAGGNIIALTLEPDSARRFMVRWQKQPLWVYRLWGVAAVLFSAVLIYAGIPV